MNTNTKYLYGHNGIVISGVSVLPILICIILILVGNTGLAAKKPNSRMLLVLSAPSVHNDYYQSYFDEIVTFQINYAQKIMDHNTDDVRVLVDEDTRKYYADLPQYVLLSYEMYDIWMRDFTTVNPEHLVQFLYTDASMTKKESALTQNMFNNFADTYNLEIEKSNYDLDGGNIVDNYQGKVITTTRFLEDNNLSMERGKTILKKVLRANEVAIIEADDDVLAHADGMVAWIDDDVLAVNNYSEIDNAFHATMIEELTQSFPHSTIVEVPVVFDEGGRVDKKGIGSACGVNLNLVATYDTLYIPVFGDDDPALAIIKSHTTKKIVAINAEHICLFGGSVRCTTWQLAGTQAKKIIERKL